MIISYKLLQTYFDKKLPRPEAIADALTFHAFEIEEIKRKDGDTAIDVKVLPNRAHDCLSHRGLAREISAIMDIPLRKEVVLKLPKAHKDAPRLSVTLNDKRVLRYSSLVIEGISVLPSPKWLRDALLSLGQRSINNVVDATNYVMFMSGQPLHAFDLAKIDGGEIVVRSSKKGEELTTLDGKEVLCDDGMLVVADKKGILGIAGIKGGTKAEVDSRTTAIALEAANFDASTIRMAAQRLNIRTDASKRFESGITPFLTSGALLSAGLLILEIAGKKDVRVGSMIDVFPKKPKQRMVTITLRDINRILGTALSDKDVVRVWKKLTLPYVRKESATEAVYAITVPHERLDITIKEDLAEEVGRMIGYDTLTPRLPVQDMLCPEADPHSRVANVVRSIMTGAGFSEVYTYAFSGDGEVEVVNPIAKDKRFLRNKLMHGLKQAAGENLKYDTEVRIFELGHIFGHDAHRMREEYSFAALLRFAKRKEAEMKEDFYVQKGILDALFDALGIADVRYEEAGGELVASVYSGKTLLGTMMVNGFELDFGRMTELASDVGRPYITPSRFPSIIRDISLFVPPTTRVKDVEDVLRANGGVLMCSFFLFDVFTQPEKKSFAFRMVLQSHDRTLSDEEANAVYDRVVFALRMTDPSWEVRA